MCSFILNAFPDSEPDIKNFIGTYWFGTIPYSVLILIRMLKRSGILDNFWIPDLDSGLEMKNFIPVPIRYRYRTGTNTVVYSSTCSSAETEQVWKSIRKKIVFINIIIIINMIICLHLVALSALFRILHTMDNKGSHR